MTPTSIGLVVVSILSNSARVADELDISIRTYVLLRGNFGKT
jgi:hypothetical protein